MTKMAEGQWGGKRTPRNPAPVSAPGALSRRTDGGPQQSNPRMSGMPYGENQDFEEMQSAAPMSASPTAKRAGGKAKAAPQGPGATPLFEPTARPDEPVTAGAPFGPGEGPPMNPGATNLAQQDAQMLGKYLPEMMVMANDPNTPDGFKRFVRHLRNVQGSM